MQSLWSFLICRVCGVVVSTFFNQLESCFLMRYPRRIQSNRLWKNFLFLLGHGAGLVRLSSSSCSAGRRHCLDCLGGGRLGLLTQCGRSHDCRSWVGLGGRSKRLSGSRRGRHGRPSGSIDLTAPRRPRNHHSDYSHGDRCDNNTRKNDLPRGSAALARSVHRSPPRRSFRLMPAHPALHRSRLSPATQPAQRCRHAQMSKPNSVA